MKTAVSFSFILVFSLLAPVAARAEGTVSLETLLRQARENNPDLRAARGKRDAAKARITAARTWDDPKLTAEYMGIPEGGFELPSASEKLYGIEQMIPFPGKLRAMGKAAAAESEAMNWEYTDTERRVLAELRASYALYYYLARSIETYRETAQLMRGYSKIAESQYVAGKAGQGDVLRAQVEAEKMSNMVITLGQEKETARVELNLLIGKNADDPLGEPEAVAPDFLDKSWDDVKALAQKNSPDAGRAAADLARGKWEKSSALLSYLPDFDVTFRRRMMGDAWSGSEFMVGARVPLWFWKQKADLAAASAEVEAAEAAKRKAELMSVSRAKEIYTKLDATKRLMELYSTSIIPKAEQSLRVAQAGFSAGRSGFLELLDSVRSYLEFKLEYNNYVADYQRDRAALERVIGTEGSL